MTVDIEALLLEQLRASRADLFDVKGRLGNVELNLATLGQQIGALTTAVSEGKSELDGLRQRTERIEQRLELSDT